MIHSYGCKQELTQYCLACGTRICACHGTGHGACPVCYRGMLSQYYKPHKCGYKGCREPAVAESPRVGHACLKHAIERGGYKGADPRQVAEYQQEGPLAYYSGTVESKIAAWRAAQ